ncbi:DNA replication protein DnaC [Bacillus mycoides]
MGLCLRRWSKMAAMIDRLAHHGHLLVFEGEGYRTKHALMKER